MDSTAQAQQVIKSLRPSDLVGHRQQTEQHYEVMTMVEQRLLAARWFIVLQDVVVPF